LYNQAVDDEKKLLVKIGGSGPCVGPDAGGDAVAVPIDLSKCQNLSDLAALFASLAPEHKAVLSVSLNGTSPSGKSEGGSISAMEVVDTSGSDPAPGGGTAVNLQTADATPAAAPATHVEVEAAEAEPFGPCLDSPTDLGQAGKGGTRYNPYSSSVKHLSVDDDLASKCQAYAGVVRKALSTSSGS
jgi:hypothetical protein